MRAQHPPHSTDRFERIEHVYDITLKWISGCLTFAMLIVLLLGVSSRKFGFSLPWYDEVAVIMLAWLTYIGAALVALHSGHIGMDNIAAKAKGGLRTALIYLRAALICLFFGVLAWQGLEVIKVMSGFTLITVPWMPVAVTQSIIPIGSILFIVAEGFATRRRLLGHPTFGTMKDTVE